MGATAGTPLYCRVTSRAGTHVKRNSELNKKISWIPNGISAPDIDSLVPTGAIRHALDVTEDMLLVVCVARLESEKNIDDLSNCYESRVRRISSSEMCYRRHGSLHDHCNSKSTSKD